MKERCQKAWRRLKQQLPSVSRKGKVIRNFAFVLVTVVLFWWAIGAPGLTPQWRYRQAERRNLIRDTEIIAVLEPRWINWDGPAELVVAENKDVYVLCLTNEPFGSLDLQVYEKQGDVTLTGVPESFTTNFNRQSIPFTVLTELPAVRAELEITLPPELFWRWDHADGREPFAGAVCRGEDRNEDGVFTFSFPSGLVNVDPDSYAGSLSDQLVLEWDALHILSETLQGIKPRSDYDCSVTAHIRLWDAQDQLICDETLTYEIKR